MCTWCASADLQLKMKPEAPFCECSHRFAILGDRGRNAVEQHGPLRAQCIREHRECLRDASCKVPCTEATIACHHMPCASMLLVSSIFIPITCPKLHSGTSHPHLHGWTDDGRRFDGLVRQHQRAVVSVREHVAEVVDDGRAPSIQVHPALGDQIPNVVRRVAVHSKQHVVPGVDELQHRQSFENLACEGGRECSTRGSTSMQMWARDAEQAGYQEY